MKKTEFKLIIKKKMSREEKKYIFNGIIYDLNVQHAKSVELMSPRHRESSTRNRN